MREELNGYGYVRRSKSTLAKRADSIEHGLSQVPIAMFNLEASEAGTHLYSRHLKWCLLYGDSTVEHSVSVLKSSN